MPGSAHQLASCEPCRDISLGFGIQRVAPSVRHSGSSIGHVSSGVLLPMHGSWSLRFLVECLDLRRVVGTNVRVADYLRSSVLRLAAVIECFESHPAACTWLPEFGPALSSGTDFSGRSWSCREFNGLAAVCSFSCVQLALALSSLVVSALDSPPGASHCFVMRFWSRVAFGVDSERRCGA